MKGLSSHRVGFHFIQSGRQVIPVDLDETTGSVKYFFSLLVFDINLKKGFGQSWKLN